MIIASNAAALPSDLNASLAVNIATGLTILCWLFLLGVIITRFSPTLKMKFNELFMPKARLLMWLIPISATAFSLYFSEVLNWAPCKLCWVQRSFMYPLAFFMMLNFFKSNKIMRIIAYAICSLGALVAIYHATIEKFPNLESTSCDPTVPCTQVWFESIGFIKIGEYSNGLLTIAGMSFTAFVTVLVILFISKEKKEVANG